MLKSEFLQEQMKKCKEDVLSPEWKVHDNLLYYKGKIFSDSNSELIFVTVKDMHSAAHEGLERTLFRVRQVFRW